MDEQGDRIGSAHGLNPRTDQLYVLNVTWQGMLTNETRDAVLQGAIDILDQMSQASDEDADDRDILQDSEIELGAEVEVDRQNVGGEEEQEDITDQEVHDDNENVMYDPLPGGSRKRCREEDSDDEEANIRHAPQPPRYEEDEESSDMYTWNWNHFPDSVYYNESSSDSE